MRPVLLSVALCATWFAACEPGAAAEPLHQQIDRLIEAKAGGAVAGSASDAAFCRRVYLDLSGRIPTQTELKAFLDDPAADKRTALIDKLLAAPEYAAHMATVFHVMLSERLGEHPEWNAWLLESFQKNKPWDQMAREMLALHLDDSPTRGAGFFVAKRLENYGQNPVDYPALVRDVGRLMLGVDLQCAQCHDHPQIDDYKQVDYQGLYAYFANVSLRSSGKYPAVEEKPLAMKIEFQSVFVSGKHQVGPRIPFGMETMLQTFEKGQEFEIAPDRAKQHPGVLKFSPLRILANDLPRGETPGFAKNIANRLWWHMLGRGLVHPLDLHHGANPPSHPEVLELLAQELIAHQFDLKWLMRELALTQTYQRASELPAGATPEAIAATSYRTALEKGLSPEQMARSLWTATGPWPDDKPLADLTARCVRAFAQPPREPEVEFAPSVRGALFLAHDSAILKLLDPAGDNLSARLARLTDDKEVADQLYLSLLSRPAIEAEQAAVRDHLQAPGRERSVAIKQYLWALVSSTEFCVNH